MTFSILALCRRTGAFGGALATSSMAVGSRCLFVAPGAGAVVSQARSDPRLGALGMKQLEGGASAPEALAQMLAATPHAGWRQLAVLDRFGNTAEFTGLDVMGRKGARTGDGAVAIGNAVAGEAVIAAILEGFAARPNESLADRLIGGLERGLAAGGETSPLQSAALRVAYPDAPFTPIDLRVDYAPAPIHELRRFWTMWAPKVDGYVKRALDPAHAPPAEEIERLGAGRPAG